MAQKIVPVPLSYVKLNSMRKQSLLTDIVLVCGGKEFEAHRNILSATSEFLCHLVASGKMEESAKPRVEVPNIQPYSLEVILDILYTGRLPPVDFRHLPDLISALHFMELHYLYKYYRDMFMVRLDNNNYYIYWKLGETLEDPEILNAVYELTEDIYIQDGFKYIDVIWLRHLFGHLSTKAKHNLLLKIIVEMMECGTLLPPLFDELIEYVDFQKVNNNILSDCIQHPLLMRSERFKEKCLLAASQRIYFLELSKTFNTLPDMIVFGQSLKGTCMVQKCRLGEWENSVTFLAETLDNAKLLVSPFDYKIVKIATNENKEGILQVITYDKQWHNQKIVKLGEYLPNFTVEAVELDDVLIVRIYQGYVVSDFVDCIKESSCQFINLYSDDKIIKLQFVTASKSVFMMKQVKTSDGKIFFQVFKLSGAEYNFQWYCQGRKEWINEELNWFSYFYPPDHIVVRYFPGISLYFNIITKQFQAKEDDNGLTEVVSLVVFRWNVVCLTKDGWIHFQDIRRSTSSWKTLTKCPFHFLEYFKITVESPE